MVYFNGVYNADGSAMQKCKNNPSNILTSHFPELLTEFVSIVTDEKCGQDIVSDLNVSLLESDEISDNKHSDLYGYPPITFVPSKAYPDLLQKYVLVNMQAARYLHNELTEYSKNVSSAEYDQASLLSAADDSTDKVKSSESDPIRDIISYNTNRLPDESKTELSKVPSLVKLNQESWSAEFIDSGDLHDNSEYVKSGESVKIKGEVFGKNEQSGKQKMFVPENKLAVMNNPKSLPQPVSSEVDAVEKNKPDSESLTEYISLFSAIEARSDSESHIVIPDAEKGTEKELSRKDTYVSTTYESSGKILFEKEMKLEEIHVQSKKSSDQFVFGLKHTNWIISNELQQKSVFDSSNYTFAKIHDSGKGHTEQSAKLNPDLLQKYVLVNMQAARYLHYERTEYSENVSSAKYEQVSPIIAAAGSSDKVKHSESDSIMDIIYQNKKVPTDVSKTELVKVSPSAKLSQENFLKELTGNDRNNQNSESENIRKLIASTGVIFEKREQLEQQQKYFPDKKLDVIITTKSAPKIVSSESFAALQNKQDSESLTEYISPFSAEEVRSDSETHIMSRDIEKGIEKKLSRKDTSVSSNYESACMISIEKETSFEEVHGQRNKSLDKFMFDLKQTNLIASEEFRQNTGFENSDNNFLKIHVLEKGHAEKPESLFRNNLFNAANQNESAVHAVESIKKHMVKADIMMQVAEKLTVMSHDGRAEMEVQIYPENLGKVLLKVVNENSLYSAQITAETYQAMELLQSHLSELKTILKEQGFNFFQLDVGLSDSQSNNRRWFTQDNFYLKESGKLINGTKEQFTDIVERNYIKAKNMGHIDCLV